MTFQFNALRGKSQNGQAYAVICSESAGKGRSGIKVTLSVEAMRHFGLRVGSRILFGYDEDTGRYGIMDNSKKDTGIKLIATDSKKTTHYNMGALLRSHGKQTLTDHSVVPNPSERLIFCQSDVTLIDGVIVFGAEK